LRARPTSTACRCPRRSPAPLSLAYERSRHDRR
jgi:hypothetical protein